MTNSSTNSSNERGPASPGSSLVVAVIARMGFRGFGRVVVGVVIVSGREMRVMPGLLVVSRLVVLRSLAVMVRGVIVMLGGFVMVFGG